MPFPLTSVAVGVPETISAVVTSMVVVCDSFLASDPCPQPATTTASAITTPVRAKFPTMKPFFLHSSTRSLTECHM